MARIALRFSGPEPVLAPAPPVWQALLARLIHLALYAFMIAMPLLAWLYYSLKAKPLWFYGMELPPLLGADAALAKQLRLMYWHRHLAEWGYWLIGLHAAAALFHHYVVKDNALLRMLPRRRSMTASP